MDYQFVLLLTTAASLGFFHTIVGPDHYVPFIVMSKARFWSLRRTLVITFLCGLGHVLSSVVLGFIGVAFGIAVFKLEVFESMRGDFAGWLLLIFGFTYGIWGLWQALRRRPHRHPHRHTDGISHSHEHRHTIEHTHMHVPEHTVNMTPWILFTIFVFGPCEPLIPLLMYPAAQGNLWQVAVVATVFSTITIATMLTMVCIFSFSLKQIKFGRLQRYAHALAGFTIFLCGGAIKFLGL